MKLYLLEDGLRGGTKFQEAVGIMEMKTLDEFFELAQRYIKWVEKQIASEVRRPKNLEASGPFSQREERRGDEKKRDSGKVREAKPPKSQFTYYTPLIAPRDRILSEISNAEFKIISGGGFNPVTIESIKRKFDELEKASPVGEIKITEVKENSVPLAFYREEVPGRSPNIQFPLLVRAKMANFDVRRILIDQGSSCDIMYSRLFKVLQLTEENLVPYVGSDLQGFNGSTTKPWGYVDLIVTFGENTEKKSLEDLYGKEIPRTWNAEKLKQYYRNTPCEPHRCLVHARQNAQLAMGYSTPRGKSPNNGAFLDSSLGVSQTLVQFHKLLGNGAYDSRHQEATVIIGRALAQR
ncbi:hypothetical protein TSUD_56680 [Trifolium subterraneum]|uniref:Uncharacterized protein n=1 Tax=Trifolium subterraneum TaxID=3900 RepID=A0A2Z6MWI7_TRISU|nr:hypothetical protein TSUD_56680 [Trifolium subterraneum]